MANRGQTGEAPLGSVVETFCVFDRDQVTPLTAKPLPPGAADLVRRNAQNLEALHDAIRARDLEAAFQVFLRQPLMSRLTEGEGRALFREMVRSTEDQLAPWYDLRI